ncbi:DUF2383 domain-containing protein [Dyella sp.]|jgi:uncharacterized protein (TIGR02284 family)|uniref:DUF2383 domain-containing protein n=1 Tax=Dyella sp. TaxID=1869338 RepID=UPI002D77E045|nr:DUF2383 domain-containing protein [Dyella sp.]HET6431864.1 DUF2383 domain-containing protein [Dyella sp.]
MSLASPPPYNALIRRCIDLQRLCQHAARNVSEPGLRVVLQETAAALELLVIDLQTQAAASGRRPASRGRWSGPLQRRLTSLWMHGAPLRDDQWIRLLARREAAVLQLFEQTVGAATPDNAPTLRRLLPQLQAVHLDMHSLAAAAR